MYTVHDWAEVRRLHERDHLSKKHIAERLGMSRTTVHRSTASVVLFLSVARAGSSPSSVGLGHTSSYVPRCAGPMPSVAPRLGVPSVTVGG